MPIYGISLLIAVAVVFVLALKSVKAYGYTYYDLLIVGAFILMFSLPSGSLLYTVVTYSPAEIIKNLMEGNLRFFGGLVFFGALIGGIIGAMVGIRVAGLNYKNVEMAVVPYIPIGHSIGRVGCVFAGCCYGMEYEGAFAIYYKRSVAGAVPGQGYFPVQLLEACINIILCFALLKVRTIAKKRFSLLAVYLVFYATARFILEFFRGDKIRGIYFYISTSQWISLLLLALGSVFLVVRQLLKNHKCL